MKDEYEEGELLFKKKNRNDKINYVNSKIDHVKKIINENHKLIDELFPITDSDTNTNLKLLKEKFEDGRLYYDNDINNQLLFKYFMRLNDYNKKKSYRKHNSIV